MKKWMLSLLLLSGACLSAGAQDFEPKESWPYPYQDFLDGAVRTTTGTLAEGKYNVYVGDGSLHYINDGLVMRVDMSKVYTVLLGGKDMYVNVFGRLYKLLSEMPDGHAAVLECMEVDMEALNKVNVGYGVSVSSAVTRSANPLALGALVGSKDTMPPTYDKLIEERYAGRDLPLKKTLYLYTCNTLIRASRQAVLAQRGVDAQAAKAFFKEKKIKWNKVESLLEVSAFVYGELTK